jgi:flavin-dependent dehydrogenase
VVAFLDRDSIWPLQRSRLEALWRSTLAKAELFSRIASAPLVDTLSSHDATTYFAQDPIGEDQIRVGEACFSLDPLSSTGVEKAMHSGLIAATAIHTILVRPERASLCARFYRARQLGGKPALQRAKVTKQVSYHTFRHTFGTLLMQTGRIPRSYRNCFATRV